MELPGPRRGPSHGRKQREFDQAGRKTEFCYDHAGRLVEVHQWKDQSNPANPQGEVITSYEYDVRGNRTAQVDALGRRTTFEYDMLGRLRAKHYPAVGGI